MGSFREIIGLWPTTTQFAVDINVPENSARAFLRRNSIPARYWFDVIAAAERNGYAGVTAALMSRLAKERSRRPLANSEARPAA